MREEILRYIIDYLQEHGYAPSVREIAGGVGLKSPSSVHRYLVEMINEGILETDAEVGTPRTIRVRGWKYVKE